MVGHGYRQDERQHPNVVHGPNANSHRTSPAQQPNRASPTARGSYATCKIQSSVRRKHGDQHRECHERVVVRANQVHGSHAPPSSCHAANDRTRRAGYKSSPQEEHLAHLSSSDTPVVVMEPTEHGDCVDAAIRLEWTWNRLLVPEGLVRTRFVVVADVLGDDAPEVILTEDEDVVEHLSPECADEAFSEGIHVRCAYRRAHDAHPRRPEYASEANAELRVVVADDNLWRAVHGGVSDLLRAPLIGRRIGHRGTEDRSATQVQEEEYEHLAEPHVERLHEVTRPSHVV